MIMYKEFTWCTDQTLLCCYQTLSNFTQIQSNTIKNHPAAINLIKHSVVSSFERCCRYRCAGHLTYFTLCCTKPPVSDVSDVYYVPALGELVWFWTFTCGGSSPPSIVRVKAANVELAVPPTLAAGDWSVDSEGDGEGSSVDLHDGVSESDDNN